MKALILLTAILSMSTIANTLLCKDFGKSLEGRKIRWIFKPDTKDIDEFNRTRIGYGTTHHQLPYGQCLARNIDLPNCRYLNSEMFINYLNLYYALYGIGLKHIKEPILGYKFYSSQSCDVDEPNPYESGWHI